MSDGYPVPTVNHMCLSDELFSLLDDTNIQPEDSIFCLVTFRQFMVANYPEEAIKSHFPCLYQLVFNPHRGKAK